MSEANGNQAIVERFFTEVLGQGRLETFDELMADDYVFRATHLPGPTGVDGHRAMVIGLAGAFSDWDERVVEMIADGDRVVTRLHGRGTHTGPFMGIPATGRTVTVDSVNIDRVVDGRIRERWMMADGLSVLQQLGVVPPLN